MPCTGTRALDDMCLKYLELATESFQTSIDRSKVISDGVDLVGMLGLWRIAVNNVGARLCEVPLGRVGLFGQKLGLSKDAVNTILYRGNELGLLSDSALNRDNAADHCVQCLCPICCLLGSYW